MPTVPRSENQINVKQVRATPMQLTGASEASIGRDVFKAQNQMTNSLVNLGSEVAGLVKKEQDIASEKKLAKLNQEARKELDDLVYSTELDPDKKPKGFLNRELGMSSGISKGFTDSADEIINRRLADLSPEEQERFIGSISPYRENYYRQVNKHEANEKNRDEELTFKSSMKTVIDGASKYDDDDLFNDEISKALENQNQFLAKRGHSEEVIGSSKRDLVTQMVESNILNKLESNPEKAKQTLLRFKDSMNQEQFEKLNKAADGAMFDNGKRQLWEGVFSKMKTSDGYIDLDKANKYITSSKFNDEQKDKLFDYVQAKSGEQRQIKNQKEASLERSFFNDLYARKKEGASIDEAMKLVGRYGIDNLDRAQKEEAIKKLFTNPSAKSDPGAYIALWEKVESGESSKEEIDKAFNRGEINVSDWENLRKGYYKGQVSGENSKGNMERIKLLAEETFGKNDKEEKQRFLYEMAQATKGMKKDEAFAYAQDAFTKVNKSKFLGIEFGGRDKWEVDLERRDANSTVWGKLESDIGADNIKEIGKWNRSKGAGSYGLDNINNFAKELGGMNNLKEGTPTRQAIEALRNAKKPITPANVKAVLNANKVGMK